MPFDLPRQRLGRLGSTILHFDSIPSTNDVAASFASRSDGEGAIIVADQQTAGRGRRGHDWFSPPRSGLYVSVVLTPADALVEPARATTLLTIAAGVALGEGIEAATGLVTALKWPNDVYSRSRKLAGILAEAVSAGRAIGPVVLGYGINVNATVYPPALAARATSLESEVGGPVDRERVLVETLAALAQRYDDLLNGRFDAILDAWRARAFGIEGARVAWSTSAGPRHGVTIGIADDGALLVDVDGRTERIVGGELDWSGAFDPID